MICTDNDEGGIDAAHRLWDILSERGYDNMTIYPPNNKDWNEDLKEEKGVPFIPAVPHKRLEEYERQAESLQYYSCRIEKLRSQLNAAFQNGQYRYLAEYALAGSVFFRKKQAQSNMPIGISKALRIGWQHSTAYITIAQRQLVFGENWVKKSQMYCRI